MVSNIRMILRVFMTALFVMLFILGLTVSAKPASHTNSSITGEWAGTVKCSRNRGLDINLRITSNSGGLAATMETYGAKTLLGKVWTHKLVGRYEAGSGSYLFVPVRHSRGPRGISKGFSFIPSGNGKRARGKVLKDQCQSFSVKRITANSTSRRSTTARPSNGGSYFAANGTEQKCKEILKWAQRIDREYPRFDMMRTSMGKVYSKAVLLFADNNFVPVFGQPYDSIDRQALQKIWDVQWWKCSKDPFLRQSGGWVWGHPVLNALKNYKNDNLGGFPKAPIVRHIRKVRRAHNELKLPRPAIGRSDMTQINNLLRIKREISKKGNLFWPSEQASVIRKADRRIEKLAMAMAERVLRQLAKITDPDVGIRLTRNTMKYPTGGFFRYIADSQKKAVRAKIDSYEERFVGRVEGRIIAKVKSVPNTIEGANMLHKIVNGKYPSINAAIFAVDNNIRIGAFARRDKIIKTELSRDLKALRGYPGGFEGLVASTKWIERFSAKYRLFKIFVYVKLTRSQFAEDRSLRLLEVFKEFETALAKIKPGSRAAAREAKKLMSRYVSWQGDRHLPEYFLYKDAVAAYR